jgi:hypothetical protein
MHFGDLPHNESSVYGEKERRWTADGKHFSSVARSFSEAASVRPRICLQAACVTYATGSGFRLAKDVPILRANHVAVQDVLPGVREVAGSGHAKIIHAKIIDEFPGALIFRTLKWAKENNMLWTIFVVLLILWLLGFSLHVAGGLIHLLLVVALVVLVINLVSGRRVV